MSPEQPSNKIGKSVGEKLRAARVALHYTQSQLAAPDFSVSYISAIERGQIHPSLRALEILATRLGLTSTQLLPHRSQQEERLSTTGGLSEHDEEEIELLFVEAQILIMQGEEEIARTELELLSSKRLKKQHQLQHGYLLGWTLYNMSRYQESEIILTESARLAEELHADYLHMRILNLLALGTGAMRNYVQALQALQRCLSIARQQAISDPFFLLRIYIHLGQHYTRLDNTEAALDSFGQALQIAADLASTKQIQETYTELCLANAEAQNIELATLYGYKNAQLHNQDMIKRLQSEIYHYLGQAILQGDQEAARTYIDQTLQKPEVQRDPLTLASLNLYNAQWYFTHQEPVVAEEHVRRVLELARPFGDTIIEAEALILHGRIAYAQHKQAEGDQNFIAGLEMLEHLGRHEELADESVLYAELLEAVGREHDAFTYFRRAFQSRQKVGK